MLYLELVGLYQHTHPNNWFANCHSATCHGSKAKYVKENLDFTVWWDSKRGYLCPTRAPGTEKLWKSSIYRVAFLKVPFSLVFFFENKLLFFIRVSTKYCLAQFLILRRREAQNKLGQTLPSKEKSLKIGFINDISMYK